MKTQWHEERDSETIVTETGEEKREKERGVKKKSLEAQKQEKRNQTKSEITSTGKK